MQHLLDIRDWLPSDTGYIMETWLADLRDNDRGFLPNDIWFPAHRACIERVLDSGKVKVKVLCDKIDPNVIVGYIVADDNFIHWIHIRRGKWRGCGLAKYLMEQTGCLSLSLVWKTKLAHERLRNPVKGQLARRIWWSRANQREDSFQ